MAENNENPQARPGEPQAFAPLPGSAAGGPTEPPSWAVPPAPEPKRGRRGLVVALVVVLTAGVVTGTALVTSAILDTGSPAAAPRAQEGPANQQAPPAPPQGNNAPQNIPAGPGAPGNLRDGAVFLQSNDATANEVVAFSRKPDGTLNEVGRYPTGGAGSGSFEDAAQGLVLGSANGEASPIQNVDEAQLLFAVNAGSGTISVFRVNQDGLDLVSQVPSGGKRPVSVTVNNGVVYVLNSGETDRRLVLGPNDLLNNCSSGDRPSVTGFRVTPDGALTQIDGSTRQLAGRGLSGCSQVSFTPDGKKLVVTERTASTPGQSKPKKGVIDLFDVRFDGQLGAMRALDPSGAGPFGFNFLKNGTMIVSEQNGAMANPGGGGAVSYRINQDDTLQPVNGTVNNGQTDTCWITVTRDQKLAFATSAFGGGAITSYRVRDDGGLEMLNPVASAPDGKDVNNDVVKDGLSDEALSRNTDFLYQLNSVEGSLWVFKVNPDGKLTYVENHPVFPQQPFGMGGEAAPMGIAAW